VALAASGCASIVTGHNQPVSVETRYQGQMVSGASCKLENSKGTWYVTTPGTTTVHRAYGDLAVACTHEKHESGSASVTSSTKAMAFGNIIFGGAIGVTVDVATGAAYDYPTLISLDLGAPLLVPRAMLPTAGKPVAVADKPAEPK
jgi:hypothetical protein